MSIRLMTIVWDVTFPTQSQKLLALKLADYAADSGGSVFPSNETMADKVGCDERTVQRAMKAFRDCGLIHLVRQGGGKPGATNEWKLNVTLLSELASGISVLVGNGAELVVEDYPQTGDKMSGVMGDTTPGNLSGGVTFDTGGVTPVSPTPDTRVTQSVINRQIEPSVARARASDEGTRAAAALRPKSIGEFAVRNNDPSWNAWIDHLRTAGNEAAIGQAEIAGKIIVSARWPHTGSARFIRVEGASPQSGNGVRGKMAAVGSD